MGLYTHAHTRYTHLYLRRKSKIRNWYGNVMSECVPFRICMHSMANFNCSDRSFKLSHFRTKCLHFGNFAQQFHAFDRTKFKREREKERKNESKQFFCCKLFFRDIATFFKHFITCINFFVFFIILCCSHQHNQTKKHIKRAKTATKKEEEDGILKNCIYFDESYNQRFFFFRNIN